MVSVFLLDFTENNFRNPLVKPLDFPSIWKISDISDFERTVLGAQGELSNVPGVLNSSTPLLSIALHFIARSLPSTEGPGSIDQNPLKMLERPTFTMRDSY